jgi:inner membrane transporter RhtA
MGRAAVGPGWLREPPARVMVITGAFSVQFGAAIATQLFTHVGPSGAVGLRLAFAAVMLGVVVLVLPARSGQGGWRSLRGMSGRDFGVAAVFGVVLAGMNLSFYEAIARVPLGVGVTVEFAGPLAVTLIASRRPRDLVWAGLAGAGVLLLAGRVGHHLDIVGVTLALVAAAFWATYILLSAETGRRFPGASGLAVAMVVSAVIDLPIAIAHAGTQLLTPTVLGMGAAVALLSSALPYSLELAALRRLTPRAFGILMSLDPGIAAAAGLVILGQRLSAIELAALVLVMGANVGSTLSDRNPATAADVTGAVPPVGKTSGTLAVETDAGREPPGREVEVHQ